MINKSIVIGNLTSKPETSFTPNGTARAKFTVACNEKWTDKTTGEKKERADFVPCVAWGKLAEIIGQYADKGRQVYVEGRFTVDSWEKDGAKQYFTYIKATEFKMLGVRPGSGNQPPAASPDAYGPVGGGYSGNQDDDQIPF